MKPISTTKRSYKFKTKPDDYQLDALKEALKKEKMGIFFQQRVGKTKVAIDFCGAKSIRDKSRKVLIVSPLSVREEWVSQLNTHLGVKYKAHIYPRNPKKKEVFLSELDTRELTFVVLNYDIVSKEEDRIKRWKPDIIIFDESHLLKNPNSKRSKAAYRISKDIKSVLLLTGTPIPKRWYDIFSQFRVMNYMIFGSSWAKFRDKNAIMGGFKGKEIVDCKDFDYISHMINANSIRVLRKDVFDEPDVEDVIIPVVFEPKARRVYDEIKKQFIAELTGGVTITADMAITRLMRLHQICGGFVKTDEGELIDISHAKLDTLLDLVDTKYEGGEQVVVFHRYQAEGKAIIDALRSRKLRVGAINGQVNEDDRLKYRTSFQNEKLDVIVIQISTGAMGITLDKAHINIFYSMDFSLSNYLQARDRVMGRNQKHDVTNYFLSVDKSVDKKIIETIQKDEDVASMVADKWRWILE